MKNLFTLLLTVLCLQLSTAQITITEAVDFTVTDIHGDEHHLFDILDEGKYVLVDLYAYWCGPCCTTAPLIKETYESYGCNTGGLYVLGLEADGTTAQTEAFETDCGSADGHPVASGLDGGGSDAVDAYMPSAFPTIILIAPDRTIIEQDIWPYTIDGIDAIMSGLGVEKQECSATVSVEDELTSINAIQLSPNPAKDMTILDFELVEAAKLSVEVLSITGQQVSFITLGDKSVGNHQVELNTTDYAEGSYFVKVVVNGVTAKTIKMNKL